MQCLKIYLFCDGDLHCKDGSDEDIEHCAGTMYREMFYFDMRIPMILLNGRSLIISIEIKYKFAMM
jgi:hypothetical protein